jgi:hypothetical protein
MILEMRMMWLDSGRRPRKTFSHRLALRDGLPRHRVAVGASR